MSNTVVQDIENVANMAAPFIPVLMQVIGQQIPGLGPFLPLIEAALKAAGVVGIDAATAHITPGQPNAAPLNG